MRLYRFLAIVILSILIGCNPNEEVLFQGESEHWGGSLESPTENNGSLLDLMITYKGDIKELYSMEKLTYSFDFDNYGGETTLNFNGNSPTEKSFKTLISKREVNSNGVIEITVQWLGKEENFELTN